MSPRDEAFLAMFEAELDVEKARHEQRMRANDRWLIVRLVIIALFVLLFAGVPLVMALMQLGGGGK